MAKPETIAKLHAPTEGANLPAIAGKSPVENSSAIADQLPNERPVRGRFRLSRPEPPETGYQLDPSQILGTMAPAAPVDHPAGRFAALVEKDRLADVVRRHLAARGVRVF